MSQYGGHSMFGPLKRVVVRRPTAAFAVDDIHAWNYVSRPDLEIAQKEHDYLVSLLEQDGVEVTYHDADLPEHADSIFVYDPVWVTDEGVIVLSLGKNLRRGEEEPLAACLESLGLPILGRLTGEARADGGDLLWLGPNACLHLLSMISVVDHDLVVVYPPLFPVPLWKLLAERGFRKVEVPDTEFMSMAPNVLATAPGRCVMIEGNPITQDRLEKAGCSVRVYRGEELSLKAEGGPTCLTRPVYREG